MGRKAGWILGAVLAVALYATPAAAQVSVSVGIGVPPVAAGVVIGGPVPVYPAYPPYYYYPYGYYPYPVYGSVYYAPRYYYGPRGPYYYRGGAHYYGGARYYGGQRYYNGPAYRGTVQRIEAPARRNPGNVQSVPGRQRWQRAPLLARQRAALVRHVDQPIAAAHVLVEQLEQRLGDRAGLAVADRLAVPLRRSARP